MNKYACCKFYSRFFITLLLYDVICIHRWLRKFWCVQSMFETGMVTAGRQLVRFRCVIKYLIFCTAISCIVKTDLNTYEHGKCSLLRLECEKDQIKQLLSYDQQQSRHAQNQVFDIEQPLSWLCKAQDPQQSYDLLLQAAEWQLLSLPVASISILVMLISSFYV